MKKNKISAFLLLLLAFATIFGSISVSAAEPYQTYTYSIDGRVLYSPAAYAPALSRDSTQMKIPKVQDKDGLKSGDDLEVGPDNRVYIADSVANKIHVLSPYYEFLFDIDDFHNGTSYDKLSGPKGVFVSNEFIYVCDTENFRIVVFDLEGDFVRIIEKPQSALFGADSSYKPIAMAVDQHGRLFVVSSTTYQGIIVMTEDGTFTGFIGAQKVTPSAWDIIWNRFKSEEEKMNSVQLISTTYNNISIDEDGFIYVTNLQDDPAKQQAAIESKSADYSPIKKLNSAGEEIMKRNGFFGTGGEVDVQNVTASKDNTIPTGASQVRDVAIGPEYTYTIIDTARNKLFTYDSNGQLLFAFGDTGIQLGNTATLSAVTYQKYGDPDPETGRVDYKMLTFDSSTKMITVYTCTEYGHLLYEALHYENIRDYVSSVDAWESVLARNNNFDAAYIGVGKALYRDGKYEEAMEYFQAAYDTDNYSTSYGEVRKDWIANYLWVIPIVLFVFIFALGKLYKYAGKVNKKVAVTRGKRTYLQELLYSFHLRFHPFDGFWDLKHEKRGSIRAALTIFAVTIFAFYYQSIGTGYLLNPQGAYASLMTQVISLLVPLALFVIANWCLTTLFDGEGSLKDVLMATCYSLAPLPLLLIVSTFLSNIVTNAEAQIVTMLVTIGYIWVGGLLFFGTMVIHDYSLGKNFLTILGTILGMAIIIFVAVLFGSLVGKIVSFISNIIVEINYRI